MDYESLAWVAPALRSHYDRLHKPRLPYAPASIPGFVAGLERAPKHPHVVMPSVTLKTFFPPVDIFAYVGASKAARFIWMAMRLLPDVHPAR